MPAQTSTGAVWGVLTQQKCTGLSPVVGQIRKPQAVDRSGPFPSSFTITWPPLGQAPYLHGHLGLRLLSQSLVERMSSCRNAGGRPQPGGREGVDSRNSEESVLFSASLLRKVSSLLIFIFHLYLAHCAWTLRRQGYRRG